MEPTSPKAKVYCADCKKMVTTHDVVSKANGRVFTHCDECTRWLP